MDILLLVLNLYINIYTGTAYSKHVLLPLHFEDEIGKKKE